MKTSRYVKVAAMLLMMTGLSACVGVPMSEFDIMPPQVNRISHTYASLVSLPEPKGQIKVSVYQFRDQTGQFKPQTNVSSFSTAVTQGAANMLIQALDTSHWFTPVEREGLQNLLTERKIIAATDRSGSGEAKDLPPLESANLLLQGGITAYETNLLTGGFGAKYWGLGGSTQYRQDQVTVHLRAVDVRTGRVLKAVTTSKTIFSHEVDAGLFRYLTFKKLVEIEAGYSHNEPVQMCVAAAIEKAVIALVVEGLQDNLWVLKNPEDINNPVIKEYKEDAARVTAKAETDRLTAKDNQAARDKDRDNQAAKDASGNLVRR
jgi:curli production assembly/transport component CsgG